METQAEVQRITHEAERISRAGIVHTTIWTLLFAALLAAVSVEIWHLRTRDLEPAADPRVIRAPEGPVLSNVRMDLIPRQVRGRGFGRGAGEALNAEQRRMLQEFGWVDRPRGLVRIPIEDAIELELGERR